MPHECSTGSLESASTEIAVEKKPQGRADLWGTTHVEESRCAAAFGSKGVEELV